MAVKKKIVLLGDSAVGKTSLIRRYVFDKFDDTYITTIGSKVTKKEMRIHRDNGAVDLTFMIWDILGRTGYSATHARTFAGVHGAFFVADLSRPETLNSLGRYWLPLLFKVTEHIPMVFAYNKSDLVKDPTYDLGYLEQVASKFNIGLDDELPSHLSTFYPTSAKTGDNVEKAFESLGFMVTSNKIPKDPLKELFESLVAEGIYRQKDKTTPIGATDALIIDFCEGFDDDTIPMSILRQEFVRADLDTRSPSKEAILKVVEFLAEAENEFKDEKTVMKNRERRMGLARRVRE